MHRRQRGEEGRGSTPQAEGTDSAKALGAGRISQTGCWLVLPRDSPHRSIFQAGLQTEGEENSPGTLPGRSSSPACSPGPLMVRPATVPRGGFPCDWVFLPQTAHTWLGKGRRRGRRNHPGVVCSHRDVMAPGLRSAAHARGQGEGSRAAVRGGGACLTPPTWRRPSFSPRTPTSRPLRLSPNAPPTHPSPLWRSSHTGLFRRNCQTLFPPGDPAPLDSPRCPHCPPHTRPSPRLNESHPGLRSPLPRDPGEAPWAPSRAAPPPFNRLNPTLRFS